MHQHLSRLAILSDSLLLDIDVFFLFLSCQGGARSAHSSSKRLVTGGGDYLVKIWREENDRWELEEKLEAHTDWVRDVAWSPSVGLPVSRIASCSQVGHNYSCYLLLWLISPLTLLLYRVTVVYPLMFLFFSNYRIVR